MLRELVLKNRSYRSFHGDRMIPDETLRGFIDLARLTPSSVNMQPLVYKISNSPETNKLVRPHTYWAKMLKNYGGPDESHSPAAYIVICADLEIAPNPDRFDRDVGIVSQTIMLAAAEAGFGGCMIGSFDKPEIAKILDIPERYSPRLVLALGVPAEEIVLEELEVGQPFQYYRDGGGVHHVPKRKLDDIII